MNKSEHIDAPIWNNSGHLRVWPARTKSTRTLRNNESPLLLYNPHISAKPIAQSSRVQQLFIKKKKKITVPCIYPLHAIQSCGRFVLLLFFQNNTRRKNNDTPLRAAHLADSRTDRRAFRKTRGKKNNGVSSWERLDMAGRRFWKMTQFPWEQGKCGVFAFPDG